VGVLERAADVVSSDIVTGTNFLKVGAFDGSAIITNPPYTKAQQFIEHALALMRPGGGLVAMLLRTDYDHAASRAHLFAHPAFAKKIVLMKRIRWLEDSTGNPSFNHAWFVWDWQHQGPPTIAYVKKRAV